VDREAEPAARRTGSETAGGGAPTAEGEGGLGEDSATAIQETVERVRALLDRMVPEDREEAVDLIERVAEDLRAGRIDQAREAQRELKDMLFYIEEA
jgi:hypothetical protein